MRLLRGTCGSNVPPGDRIAWQKTKNYCQVAGCLSLVCAEPSLVATDEAALVKAAAEDQLAIVKRNLAIIELAAFGVEDLTTTEDTVFRLHGVYDDQADDRLIVVFPLARDTERIERFDQELHDFAIVKPIRTLVDIDDRARLTSLVVNGFPIAEHLVDLGIENERET